MTWNTSSRTDDALHDCHTVKVESSTKTTHQSKSNNQAAAKKTDNGKNDETGGEKRRDGCNADS